MKTSSSMHVGTYNDHMVDFYDRDERLARRVAAYLSAGLRTGEPAVVVATAAHRQLIELSVAASGVDVQAARAEETWLELDAHAVVAGITTPNGVDVNAFAGLVGELLRRATRGVRRARVYGEILQLLWERGDVNGAMALEAVWNGFSQETEFSLYCAYRSSGVQPMRGALQAICDVHSQVAYLHGADLPRRASAHFDAVASAPGNARLFLRMVLADWGVTGNVDAAELVLTELATNALLHARSPFRVLISEAAGSVRITVADYDHTLPQRSRQPVEAFSGRGLALVEGLAAGWGCTARPDGKEVWAEVPGILPEPVVEL